MKKFIFTIICLLTINCTFAGPFEDGEAAMNSKDYATALIKYKYAAEQGNSMAIIKIGNIFDGGLGVKQDFAMAIKYYKLAARQGNVLGYIFVSAMYEAGQGVEKDLVEAERWKNLVRLCQTRNLKNCENLE